MASPAVTTMITNIRTKAYPQFRVKIEELNRLFRQSSSREDNDAIYDVIEDIKKDLESLQPFLRHEGGRKTYRKRISRRRR